MDVSLHILDTRSDETEHTSAFASSLVRDFGQLDDILRHMCENSLREHPRIERVRDAAGDAVLEPWVKRAPHDPTAQQARNVRAVAWQARGGRSPRLPRGELDTDQSDHLSDCAHVLFHFRYARLVLAAEVAKMLPPRRDVPIARRRNNELRVLSYLGPKLWSGRQAHSRT